MEVIDRIRAEQLLLTLDLKIGDWNELTVRSPSKATHRSFAAPTSALELYVAAHRLASWISSGSWTLLQIDNSTSPMDDEVAVFENLVLKGQHSWDIAAQHTFLLDGSARQSTLVLLIYFALLFTWHIHLVSEASSSGQRLALQDGVVYFFGDASTTAAADELIASLISEPRMIAS
ncbi:MAG TPA: hypothetical protein PLB25_08500 [Rhodoferax sp.]|nr:hypothetical protein [Rhodoferax sp.]